MEKPDPEPTEIETIKVPCNEAKVDKNSARPSPARRRMGVTAEDSNHIDSTMMSRPFSNRKRSMFVFYSPPLQRQRWGQTQVLPRVDWGDLFFDLFYVAATYHVSNIIVKQPNWEGLLYASGTFLPLFMFWQEKTFYDARFALAVVDVFHRLYHIVQLVVLGVAVLHTRSVDIMSHASQYSSMFVFSLCLVVERLLALGRYVELHYRGVGQTAVLRKVAKYSSIRVIPQLLLYLAATIYSGIERFGGSDDDARRILAEEVVQDSAKANATTNIPLWLCLAGYSGYTLQLAFTVVFCFPSGGRHKEQTVPVNVEFTIHRTSEWTMLMLGESIFSILIVGSDAVGAGVYYLTFLTAILTVALLQIWHFQSQPHDPNHHAMRRSKNAGVMNGIVNQLYSLTLVVLGASFTFFLTNFATESANEDTRLRTLAESPSSGDLDELQNAAATIFTVALAVIFVCLDSMEVLHRGVPESIEHYRLKGSFLGLLLLTMRAGVVAFTATLSLWVTEAEILAPLGTVLVVGQLLIRRILLLRVRSQPQAKPDH